MKKQERKGDGKEEEQHKDNQLNNFQGLYWMTQILPEVFCSIEKEKQLSECGRVKENTKIVIVSIDHASKMQLRLRGV